MEPEKYKGYKDKEKRKAYNRKYQTQYMRKYRIKLKKLGIYRKWNSPDYYKDLRKRAINKLGGPKCYNCGCTIEQILEINHKNGGGRLDKKRNSSMLTFFRDIINERADITKLDITCKVCNAYHYVSTILGIKGHKIIWNNK